MNYKPIVIVAGEPFSVFSEIFFKSLEIYHNKQPLILITSNKLFVAQMKYLKFDFKINLIKIHDLSIDKLDKKKINLINVNFLYKKTFQKITNKSNSFITKCFRVAIEVLNNNDCSGLINGPISKKHFLNNKFLGITEYLKDLTVKKKEVVMLIYNNKLAVTPITTHLPLNEVSKNLSQKKIINHVKVIKEFYKNRLKRNPKIAITGLNPHCESNYLSSEEDSIIIPAIKYMNIRKQKIKGPFPADTLFMKEQYSKYDVIIGMYHDQVLTPIKTLFGFDAINITLGLPFIRVSPDHGPNASMVGKNLSNPKSLIEALKFLDK